MGYQDATYIECDLTRQEIKDILWRLDNEAEKMTAEITQRTGDAWKAFVEHENAKKHLIHAHNVARDLEARIAATMSQLGII